MTDDEGDPAPCSVSGCPKKARKRGWCDAHYQRWRAHGDPLGSGTLRGQHIHPHPPAIDRLLSRCDLVGECWHYTGPTDRKGYIRLRVESTGQKKFGHRVAYEFFIGEIPEGLTFDHLCFNTSCVNPWHGDLVPMLVNIARARAGAGYENRLKTACPSGHPYAGDNLRVVGNGRVCVECRRKANRDYRARKKAAA